MTSEAPAFTPLNGHILIVATTAPPEKGGVLLPQHEKKRYWTGKVVKVGPGEWDEDARRRLPMAVKVGDVVLLERYTATSRDINIAGCEHFIVNENSLLGVVA